MSERLRHLQRQQVLLREHLVWIEGEITRESVPASVTTGQPPASSPANTTPAAVVQTPALADLATSTASMPSDADALIERYASSERQNPADLRRGCLLVFFSSLLLIAGGVAVAWLLYY